MDVQKVDAQQLTPDQTSALKRLHQAATQLEGVFLNMLFKAMRDTVPQETVFGKQSAGESTFQEMLDSQRADQMAQSGSFGVARVLEAQLRASVLSDASHEAKIQMPGAIEP
ncbi:MAG TPA: rod-binding protein [Candidatus Baltobacteraceae bacterium]